MAHRIQITLTDLQIDFLDSEAHRSSVSIAELVRRALDTTYGLAEERRVLVIEHTSGRRAGRPVDTDRRRFGRDRWRALP